MLEAHVKNLLEGNKRIIVAWASVQDNKLEVSYCVFVVPIVAFRRGIDRVERKGGQRVRWRPT